MVVIKHLQRRVDKKWRVFDIWLEDGLNMHKKSQDHYTINNDKLANRPQEVRRFMLCRLGSLLAVHHFGQGLLATCSYV